MSFVSASDLGYYVIDDLRIQAQKFVADLETKICEKVKLVSHVDIFILFSKGFATSKFESKLAKINSFPIVFVKSDQFFVFCRSLG